jgi:putative tryptophan/tyrosine transport system substrate-binding protein
MRRREFITLVGSAAAAPVLGPLPVRAEQAKSVPRLGILIPVTGLEETAFQQAMRDLGYIDSQNLIVEYRSAAGKAERLNDFAAELIALKVDVTLRRACRQPARRGQSCRRFCVPRSDRSSNAD